MDLFKRMCTPRCLETRRKKKKTNAPSFAYVGSYTTPGLRWVGTTDLGTGITIFKFDPQQGTLAPTTHSVVEQKCPTWLEVDPTGRFLVATHELGPEEKTGFVTCYRIDRATGDLTVVCTQETGGRGNTSVSFARSGEFLLVTRYWEGGVCVLPFNPKDGVVGPVCSAATHQGSGPHPVRQSMPHPHGFHAAPKGDLVYALDLGTDRVCQYRLTPAGELHCLPPCLLAAGAGPRGMKFHPKLPVAYVNCELDGTLVMCDVDSKTGLSVSQVYKAYPEGYTCEGRTGNHGKAQFWGAECAITGDGSFLYYICRVHQSLTIFKVGGKGELATVGRQPLLSNSNARNLTIAGDFILVASQDANQVEIFSIDFSNGSLSRTGSQYAPCAADVAIV